MELSRPIERVRQLSFVNAVNEASLARARAARGTQPAPNAWNSIRSDRRDEYLAGTRKLSQKRAYELQLEFPETIEIWESPVWQMLDINTSPQQIKTKLYQLLAPSYYKELSLDALLRKLLDDLELPRNANLNAVAIYICALKIAQREAQHLAISLGTRLGRAIIYLSVDPIMFYPSQELWGLCHKTLAAHVNYKGKTLRFPASTAELLTVRISAIHYLCGLISFPEPARHSVSPSVVLALSQQIVEGVVTDDVDKAEFTLRAFAKMDPFLVRKYDHLPVRDFPSIGSKSENYLVVKEAD